MQVSSNLKEKAPYYHIALNDLYCALEVALLHSSMAHTIPSIVHAIAQIIAADFLWNHRNTAQISVENGPIHPRFCGASFGESEGLIGTMMRPLVEKRSVVLCNGVPCRISAMIMADYYFMRKLVMCSNTHLAFQSVTQYCESVVHL